MADLAKVNIGAISEQIEQARRKSAMVRRESAKIGIYPSDQILHAFDRVAGQLRLATFDAAGGGNGWPCARQDFTLGLRARSDDG